MINFRKLKIISAITLICLFSLLSMGYFYNQKAEKEHKQINIANDGDDSINELTNTIRDLDNYLLRFQYSDDMELQEGVETQVQRLKNWRATITTSHYNYLAPYLSKQKLMGQVNEKIRLAEEYLKSPSKKEKIELAKILAENDSINLNTINLHNYNRGVLTNAINSNNQIQRLVQWMTFGILLLTIFFVLLVVHYTRIYVRQIKITEKKLHYNSSLIKNISDAIITTDKDLRITNWNEPAFKLFGYTDDEAKGEKLGEFLSVKYPHTQIIEVMDFFVSENDWKGEAIYHHKDGTPISVEVSSAVIKTVRDKNEGIILVVRDIRERNELNEKLSALSSQLQEKVNVQGKELHVVFDRVADAFMAIDNDFKYTYINEAAAELYNISNQDLIGKPIILRNNTKDESPLYQSLCKAKETQEVQVLDKYYESIKSWYQAIMYPSPGGISIYFRNITKEKASKLNLESINRRSQSFIEGTPLAVAELNAEGNVLMWNQKAEELFGWSKEEVIGKNLAKFNIVLANVALTPDKGEAVKAGEVLNNKTIARVQRKDGSFIQCQFYSTVLTQENTSQLGTMLFAEDITEKLAVEEALKETEAKFRNLVELSMIGVYIIQDERLAYVNPTFARIFGYEQNEMITTVSSIEIVHPSDRDKVAENIRSRIRKDVNSINYQFKGITKQGEAIVVEVFGSFIIYKGAPAIIGSVIDITQRIRFMEQLENNRKAEKLLTERFLLAAKATNNAMWDWDMTTNELWVNQVFKDMLGLTVADEPFTTKKFIDFVHPEDRKRLKNTLLVSLRNRSTNAEGDFRIKTPDGNYVIIHDRAYFIYDDNNWGVRILGAFQDVTEKRKAALKIRTEKDLSDSIINSLPGIFYVVDKKGQLLRWNENLSRVTEFNNEELNNITITNLIGEESIKEIMDTALEVMQGEPSNVITEVKTKSGNTFNYQLTGTYINYDGQKSLLGIGIDVSERSRIQQQLFKSEERYRMLIEQASDGIFMCNEKGEFTSVNTSMSLLTGYTREELLRMKVEEVFYKNSLDRSLSNTSDMKIGESRITEREIRTNDGKSCYVEVSYKFMIKDSYQGIVRDVTFRRAAEEALRISESKYRILFDKNPLPMFILDTNSQNFLDVNKSAQEFYGYEEQEFLSKNLFDLMEDPQNKIVLKDFGSLIRHIQKGGVYNHFKKDGTKVIMATIIHDIVYEGKSAKLIVAADETEKIKAQESLKHSHESLRQLATHLEGIREAERTHMAREIHDELGQQLTGLKMDISWLSKRLQIEDEQIQTKMKGVMGLIDKTVITVRRLATELRPSILDDLGLLPALEWQSDEFEKRTEIKSTFKSTDPSMEVADNLIATNIFRIYQESLTNVLRHSQATEVHTILTASSDSLELEISDNGRGFDPASIGNKKTLGLLGMKERVHLMGGSYNIYSKPSQGTIIKVIVPFPQEEIIDSI